MKSHPDGGRVDVGHADLEGDPARADPAGEEHGRAQLVGERCRDAAEKVPLGALQINRQFEPNTTRRHVSVSKPKE